MRGSPPERVIAMLACSFGVIATLLAAIGLYGVLAYVTAQRTRVIGIRMALRSSRIRIIRQLLTEAAMISLTGGVAGPAGSLALLPSVSAWQPFTRCSDQRAGQSRCDRFTELHCCWRWQVDYSSAWLPIVARRLPRRKATSLVQSTIRAVNRLPRLAQAARRINPAAHSGFQAFQPFRGRGRSFSLLWRSICA
ncbi:MAG: FtsX-like permease family protein [Bryobacteraceae bacterium]